MDLRKSGDKRGRGRFLGQRVRPEPDRDQEFERATRELHDIRYALDQSSIVAITDARGVITFVNDKFCEISKYSREELIGKTHRVINSGFHPPEFFVDLWKMISSGKVWRGEIRNRAKDGSFYWVATVIVPFLTPEGRPWQYVAIRTDITEKKRAEERAKEAMTAREEFLAIVSHDLKNPLSSVAMNAELIRRLAARGRTCSEEDVQKLIERASVIERSAARMHRMIVDLLDMSRIESEGLKLKCQNLPLGELIHEACGLASAAAQARSVRLTPHLDASLQNDLVVSWDHERVLQIFSNLLQNAIKFSPEGAEVRLEASMKENGVEIEVLDSGRGVPDQDVPHVFDRFWKGSAKESGTGLGLYIAKWIATAHGGRIWARNRPEGGAAFGFWLPVRPPEGQLARH